MSLFRGAGGQVVADDRERGRDLNVYRDVKKRCSTMPILYSIAVENTKEKEKPRPAEKRWRNRLLLYSGTRNWLNHLQRRWNKDRRLGRYVWRKTNNQQVKSGKEGWLGRGELKEERKERRKGGLGGLLSVLIGGQNPSPSTFFFFFASPIV